MLSRNFTPFPVLTTQRLTLRQPAITDEKEVFILRTDKEINKYLDRKIASSLDDARDFIIALMSIQIKTTPYIMQ